MHPPSFGTQPLLEGTIIRLRPFREEDLDRLWAMVNDEENRRLTGTHTHVTRATVGDWYRTRGLTPDRLDLAVATRGDDRCVGEVVLNDLDPDNRSCSLRLSLIGPSVYGQGYGSEALRLLLAHAFEGRGLNRVELEVYDHNPRARHVYAKAGFVVEGRRRQALWWDGRTHDAIVMGLLASEWRQGSWSRDGG